MRPIKYADLDSRYIFEPISVEILVVCLLLNKIGKRISVNTDESREIGFIFAPTKTCDETNCHAHLFTVLRGNEEF